MGIAKNRKTNQEGLEVDNIYKGSILKTSIDIISSKRNITGPTKETTLKIPFKLGRNCLKSIWQLKIYLLKKI